MVAALIPIWILGAPLAAIYLLSVMFQADSSAAFLDRSSSLPRSDGASPDRHDATSALEASATLATISRLSGPVSPGAISRLSGPVSPGAISRLSGRVDPGAISRLSRRVSPGAISTLSRRVDPGAISRLSRRVSPGAISTLSRRVDPGAISRLSAGWTLSGALGLPLLTKRSSSSLDRE